MSKPLYEYTDHDGFRIAVSRCGRGKHAFITVTARNSASACLPPSEIPALERALREAADGNRDGADEA